MSYSIKACGNKKCPNIVPPSKNPGVERKYCSPRCQRQAASRAWYFANKEPVPETPDTVLCGNTPCVNIVPKSKNPGVTRKFCSIRCRQIAGSRDYYQRHHGKGQTELMTLATGEQFVVRKKAPTWKAASKRRKKHEDNCPNSISIGGISTGKCPAKGDTWDSERLCLIRAVLREDEDELRRKEQGYEPQERQITTDTGFWK